MAKITTSKLDSSDHGDGGNLQKQKMALPPELPRVPPPVGAGSAREPESPPPLPVAGMGSQNWIRVGIVSLVVLIAAVAFSLISQIGKWKEEERIAQKREAERSFEDWRVEQAQERARAEADEKTKAVQDAKDDVVEEEAYAKAAVEAEEKLKGENLVVLEGTKGAQHELNRKTAAETQKGAADDVQTNSINNVNEIVSQKRGVPKLPNAFDASSGAGILAKIQISAEEQLKLKLELLSPAAGGKPLLTTARTLTTENATFEYQIVFNRVTVAVVELARSSTVDTAELLFKWKKNGIDESRTMIYPIAVNSVIALELDNVQGQAFIPLWGDSTVIAGEPLFTSNRKNLNRVKHDKWQIPDYEATCNYSLSNNEVSKSLTIDISESAIQAHSELELVKDKTLLGPCLAELYKAAFQFEVPEESSRGESNRITINLIGEPDRGRFEELVVQQILGANYTLRLLDDFDRDEAKLKVELSKEVKELEALKSNWRKKREKFLNECRPESESLIVYIEYEGLFFPRAEYFFEEQSDEGK